MIHRPTTKAEKQPLQLSQKAYEAIHASLELATKKVTTLEPSMVNADIGRVKLEKIVRACEKARTRLSNNMGNRRDEVKAVVAMLDRIHNHASSMLDAIQSSDLSSEDVKPFKKMAAKLLEEADVEMASWVSGDAPIPTKQLTVTSDAPEWKQKLSGMKIQAKASRKSPFVEEETAGSKADEALNNADRIITHYAVYKAKMPKTAVGNKKFLFLENMPVIPIFSTFVPVDALRKEGFNVNDLGSYAVLEDQTILAINTHHVKEQGLDLETYRDLILKTLSGKMNKRYMIVGDQIGYKTSGFAYFWIMPERLYNILSKTGGRSISVEEWGFAFK